MRQNMTGINAWERKGIAMKNRTANTISKVCVGLATMVQLALVANAASRVSFEVQPYAPLWA